MKRKRQNASKLRLHVLQGGTNRGKKHKNPQKISSRKIVKTSSHRSLQGTKAQSKGQINWSSPHCIWDRKLRPHRSPVLTSATEMLQIRQLGRATKADFRTQNTAERMTNRARWTRTPASGCT